ncbi:MAG: hypothetical protein RDA78_13055 [Roseibium sp.]|uniref:hypothetical protein n=1 Tax=Roseibium sp. TaxID=1936156 RepID=UPI003D9C4E08
MTEPQQESAPMCEKVPQADTGKPPIFSEIPIAAMNEDQTGNAVVPQIEAAFLEFDYIPEVQDSSCTYVEVEHFTVFDDNAHSRKVVDDLKLELDGDKYTAICKLESPIEIKGNLILAIELDPEKDGTVAGGKVLVKCYYY